MAASQLRLVLDSNLSSDWTFYLSSPTLLIIPRSSQVPALSDMESLLHLATLTSVEFGSAAFVCTTYTDLWQHWRSTGRGFYFAVVPQSQGPLYLFIFYEDKLMPQAAKACAVFTRKLRDL